MRAGRTPIGRSPGISLPFSDGQDTRTRLATISAHFRPLAYFFRAEDVTECIADATGNDLGKQPQQRQALYRRPPDDGAPRRLRRFARIEPTGRRNKHAQYQRGAQ